MRAYSDVVGEGGFEPPKSVTTDLQSAPFDRSGIPPYLLGAGGRIRTPDLLITNQLLYQLSYTSRSNSRTYLTRRNRLCQQIFYRFPDFFREGKGGTCLREIRRCRKGGRLLCSLCGGEIPRGAPYWYLNGESVCEDCLPEFARLELAPYRQTRGREEAI